MSLVCVFTETTSKTEKKPEGKHDISKFKPQKYEKKTVWELSPFNEIKRLFLQQG